MGNTRMQNKVKQIEVRSELEYDLGVIAEYGAGQNVVTILSEQDLAEYPLSGDLLESRYYVQADIHSENDYPSDISYIKVSNKTDKQIIVYGVESITKNIFLYLNQDKSDKYGGTKIEAGEMEEIEIQDP